jgi:hypothetical protein
MEESTSDLRKAMTAEIKGTMQASEDTQERLKRDVDDIHEAARVEKARQKEVAKRNLTKFIIEDEMEHARIKHQALRFQ